MQDLQKLAVWAVLSAWVSMVWHNLRGTKKVDYLWRYEHVLCVTLLFSSLKRKDTSAVLGLGVLLWFGKRIWLSCRGTSVRWFCGFGCWTVFSSVHGVNLLCLMCRISFLILACVLVRLESHAPLLVLRVPALFFWSLSRCYFTRPVYFKAVGAILNGSESPGSPPASLGRESAQLCCSTRLLLFADNCQILPIP